jgi:phosphatidyl-myo-inositol alpha-mannosyltransferase
MKIGIVVPFSWSYWGGVVEHAENQAAALRDRGHDVQILMGHDPPGRLTRLLHPRTGRHGDLPAGIIPIGRSVVVPANGSLPNIVLSPRAMLRIRDTLAEEQFDVVHLHEPMTPVVCVSALAYVKCPVVATWHAAGDLGWMRGGRKVWGFLTERIDARIAVSRSAAESADPENRLHHVVFIGRHDTRKGLPVLLQAWPEIRRRTGARLRLIGTDPLQYRLLHSRMRFDEDGIDVLGIIPNAERDRELSTAKVFVSPALGGESFGMVLVEAFAMATPVVASNIQGFADVAGPDAATLVPPGDTAALANAVVEVLGDDERRLAMADAGRALAVERYAWPDVVRRLDEIYQRVAA